MAYSYFYNRTIKAISYAFLSMFKDIYVVKYDANNSPVQNIIVPVTFNTPEKEMHQRKQPQQYIDNNNQEQGKRFYLELPRVAIVWDGITYSSQRQTDSNSTIVYQSQTLGSTISDLSPTPFDVNYTVSIRSDSYDYLAQWLEQVLPHFNPKVNLRIKEFGTENIERDMPVTLNSISPIFDLEIPETAERTIACDLTFSVAAYFHRQSVAPSTTGLIKQIETTYSFTDTIDTSIVTSGYTTHLSGVQYYTSAGIESSAIPSNYLMSGVGLSAASIPIGYDWFYESIPPTPPTPPTPAISPIAWYRGEDNPTDSLGGLSLELRAYSGYDPRYAIGVSGNCFRIASDEFNDPNELTLQYQSATNITSHDTWELEAYVNAQSASHFDIFRISDDIGGNDFITATLYMDDGHLEIANQDIGIGDPYVNFSNLNLSINTWYKIKLKYTKSTGIWQLFINDIQKSADSLTVMTTIPHNYVNYLYAIQWNSGTVYIDEIKIYTTN